jgi:AntA/AntB antirepressor
MGLLLLAWELLSIPKKNCRTLFAACVKGESHTVQIVNIRDLHTALGLEKDFSYWLQRQIAHVRPVEGRDYVKPSRSQKNGGENEAPASIKGNSSSTNK